MFSSTDVLLWDIKLGQLMINPDDNGYLYKYDKAFQKRNIEVSPLVMPVSESKYAFPDLNKSPVFRGMPGLVADSIPFLDTSILKNIYKLFSMHGIDINEITLIDYLCYIGSRGSGALSYYPSDIGDNDHHNKYKYYINRLIQEEKEYSRALSFNISTVVYEQLKQFKSFFKGIKPKVAITLNSSTGEIRSEEWFSEDFQHWIVKLDCNHNNDEMRYYLEQSNRIEYAYYLMAKKLQIDVNESFLLERRGHVFFVTKRFDRSKGKKLHIQTLAALVHADTSVMRYEYEQFIECARRMGLQEREIEQIYRQLVFRELGKCYDDNATNYTFIMSKEGKWSLSPAYDYGYTYKNKRRKVISHQMSINGKINDVTKYDLLELGNKVGFNSSFCNEVIYNTKNVIGEWVAIAEHCGIYKEFVNDIWCEIVQNTAWN